MINPTCIDFFAIDDSGQFRPGAKPMLMDTHAATNGGAAIDRAEVFSALSALNLAILALDKIADIAGAGQDVEGEVTDVRLHLQSVCRRLGEAVD